MPLNERVEYYKRLDVEAVMNTLVSNNMRLNPVFDLESGFRYPVVETSTSKDVAGAANILEELFGAGILDRDIFDMEIRRPDCMSPNVSTRYLCPACSSFHIKKTMLLEHFDCGYLGSMVTFGEPMICPKCEQPLVDGSYRNAGSIYECADCKKQIDTPFINHFCRSREYRFSFENAIYQPKWSYYPTAETKADIDRGILYTSPVIKTFEGLGMKKMDNTRVIGSSGVEQFFDLAFEGGGRKYYIDILQGNELFGELDILREYGKMTDAKVDAWVLVSPGIDGKAFTMVKSYKMNVLDGSRPDEIYAKLGSALRSKGMTSQSTLETGVKTEAKEAEKPEEKAKKRWGI